MLNIKLSIVWNTYALYYPIMIYYSASCLLKDQLGRIPRVSFNVPVYDSNNTLIDYIKGLKISWNAILYIMLQSHSTTVVN